MARKRKSGGSRKRRNPLLPSVQRDVAGSTDGRMNLGAVSALSTKFKRKAPRTAHEENLRTEDLQALPDTARVLSTASGLAKCIVHEGSVPSPLIAAVHAAHDAKAAREARRIARKARKGTL